MVFVRSACRVRYGDDVGNGIENLLKQFFYFREITSQLYDTMGIDWHNIQILMRKSDDTLIMQVIIFREWTWMKTDLFQIAKRSPEDTINYRRTYN